MPFIESPETQQGIPPFSLPGVNIASFILPADPERLNDYCEKYLNIDGRHYFRAIDDYVCLGLNIYPGIYSDYPNQIDVGFIQQNEYYFMFRAARYEATDTSFMAAKELTLVFPYIGVTNSTSGFTGQEVLGFQKLVGDIEIATTADDGFKAKVKMPAFPESGRNNPQQLLDLVSITSGPPSLNDEVSNVFPWDLTGLSRDNTDLNELADLLYATSDLGTFSVVTLKQFRDGAHPVNACYQALVRCEFRFEPTIAWVEYPHAEIEVFSNATFDIIKALGLDQGTGSKLKPYATCGTTANMWIENVTNLVVV